MTQNILNEKIEKYPSSRLLYRAPTFEALAGLAWLSMALASLARLPAIQIKWSHDKPTKAVLSRREPG